MEIKNLRYFGVFVALALLLTACGPGLVELPAAPSSTTPLAEYSINRGESWHTLTEDEVKRLDASTVWIRKTKEAVALRIGAIGDIGFRGSIKLEDDVIIAEGTGGVMIRAEGNDYAKIILE